MSTEPTQPKTNIIPASELLRQWTEMGKERREEIESRNFGFGGPPVGIEESVRLLRCDMNATMWFVDKTLKLLAAQEAKETK